MSLDESRALNADCVFLFYDLHDVWHMLSGVALVLLVLFNYHVDGQLSYCRAVLSIDRSTDDLDGTDRTAILTSWKEFQKQREEEQLQQQDQTGAV